MTLRIVLHSGLECEPVLRLTHEGYPQLHQLHKHIRELFEEDLAILGVALDMLLERWVLYEGPGASQLSSTR